MIDIDDTPLLIVLRRLRCHAIDADDFRRHIFITLMPFSPH